MAEPRWGVVATALAELDDLQRFAAWHLELGAHRVWLYLDDADEAKRAALKAHSRVRVRLCDANYWRRTLGFRPRRHQVRQGANAQHCLSRASDVDWVGHIDVDEFLLHAKGTRIAGCLARLPDTAACARIRPIEALAPGDGAPDGDTRFKACAPNRADRARATTACYPNWSDHLDGGFLSHVAGKLFIRTGLPGLKIRIHNIEARGVENPGQVILPEIDLGHFHAPDWETFLSKMKFRLEKGSYRSELKSRGTEAKAGMNMHGLLTAIFAQEGESGLRRFYRETNTATEELCTNLQNHGLLRRYNLPLNAVAAQHFPRSCAEPQTVASRAPERRETR